uniref:Actin maturation protease n=1 Tax=Panagrellus redivivus TaxID=6233 RepID=A0A7E4UX99_PANRE
MASEAPTVTTDMEVCGPLLWTRLEVAVEAKGDSANARVFFHSADGGHLQEGPTCGFVALFLAAKSAGLVPSEEYIVNVADALAWARMVGFSNLGEMFSVDWLSRVGKSFYSLGVFTPTALPTPDTLITTINAGKVFIVPYDCDKNFEPTNRNGEGAHWAAVVGYAVFGEDDANASADAPQKARISLVQLNPTESEAINPDELFVIAYQGKSKNSWEQKPALGNRIKKGGNENSAESQITWRESRQRQPAARARMRTRRKPRALFVRTSRRAESLALCECSVARGGASGNDVSI